MFQFMLIQVKYYIEKVSNAENRDQVQVMEKFTSFLRKRNMVFSPFQSAYPEVIRDGKQRQKDDQLIDRKYSQ